MSFNGCFVQDAQIGKIIGYGTEQKGFYHVDEVINGRAMLVHGSTEQQLWM